MKKAYLNENDRIECDGVEFRSGDVVEVYSFKEWRQTRIEHFDGKYQSVDGYELIGRHVRRAQ